MIRIQRTTMAALSSLAMGAILVGCSDDFGANGNLTDGVESSQQFLSQIGENNATYYDGTGKITIRVITKTTTLRQAHPRENCAPDSTEWVLVGGGASVQNWGYPSRPQGLLVGAYPGVDSLGRWTGEWNVESKDHSSISSPHLLTCIAFGLKIRGATADQIRSRMEYKYATTFTVTGSATVISPPFSAGYRLVGGGARSSYVSEGRLLTATAPSGNGWLATTKDHSAHSSGGTEVFAAAIHEASIEALVGYDIDFLAGEVDSSPNTTGFVTRNFISEPGWTNFAATALGGVTTYGGAGRLLTNLNFSTSLPRQFAVTSKDHAAVDAGGRTSVYLVGLRSH